MTASAILLITSWGCALADALVAGRRSFPRRAALTSIMCSITGAFLLAQLAHPQLLPDFERDAQKILQGQWWRVLTALLFQDGGLIGGLTNISGLLLIGRQAEQSLRRRDCVIVYLVGAVFAELVALRWQPIGAGNSIGVCSLAGAMVVLQRSGLRKRANFALKSAVIASAALLIALRDIHGIALIAGGVLAVIVSWGNL